jgi:hypothetical protein
MENLRRLNAKQTKNANSNEEISGAETDTWLPKSPTYLVRLVSHPLFAAFLVMFLVMGLTRLLLLPTLMSPNPVAAAVIGIIAFVTTYFSGSLEGRLTTTLAQQDAIREKLQSVYLRSRRTIESRIQGFYATVSPLEEMAINRGIQLLVRMTYRVLKTSLANEIARDAADIRDLTMASSLYARAADGYTATMTEILNKRIAEIAEYLRRMGIEVDKEESENSADSDLLPAPK